MIFAYHQNRHGARAPQDEVLAEFSEDVKRFPLGAENLTTQGMRQRYLKGRYNRQRLVFEEGLLSEEYTPGQIYIQSSKFNRT